MYTITGGFYFIGETVELLGGYAACMGDGREYVTVRRPSGTEMAIRRDHLTAQ